MIVIYGFVDGSFENPEAVQIFATTQRQPRTTHTGTDAASTASDPSLADRISSTYCHVQPDFAAGYLGHPRWSSPEFAAYAANHGIAAAIVHAYREYGMELMKEIRGEYVLVLVDRKKRRCILATDRFGTHPVYYTSAGCNGLYFSSSLNILTERSGCTYSVNPQAIYDYTYQHAVPSPDTVYKDVYKLEPAQQLVFSEGNLQRTYHWLPSFSKVSGNKPESLQQELFALLENSVASMEPGDGTGCFLSGGLDSSTVTGMLARLRKERVNAFSIGFSEQGFDEIPYARISAKHFDVDLHEYYITPDDIVDSIPLIAGTYDEPFGNSSAVPALYCARLARQYGMTTLLAGDGGDELFGGNERYAKQKIFELYRKLPAFLRTGVLEPLLVSSPLGRIPVLGTKSRSYIEQARLDMPERLESYNFLKRTPLETVFDREFLEQVDTSYADRLRSSAWNRADSDSLLDHMLFIDWKYTLADNDLPKVGRMCDLAGIEVRYPMLDDALVDFSVTIPSGLALKGKQLRYFYKQALSDFLPREVITKSKHGFGLPFGQWLKASDELKELVYSNLQSAKLRKIFRNDFIDRLVSLHDTGHASYYGTMVWVIVMLEEWLRQHGR